MSLTVRLSAKICIHFSSSPCVLHASLIILLDLIALTQCVNKAARSMNSSLCNFFTPLDASFRLDQRVL